ncbi:DUF397 domain-containing protein [Streptomyces sp. NPDC056347]|uniref:DUF397 domain-containing protein n=1 Tax=Streptomyces sp. NPDC056347 TaxID=3345790 RepID=UPI0035D663F8
METRPELKNARWRKSSYSGNTGGECVECTLTGSTEWRKSSYSGSTGGECVEVIDGLPCAVPVRDSKNPDGPVLTIGVRAWQSFVDGIR